MNELLQCLPAIIFTIVLIFFAIGVMVVYMMFTEDEELLVNDIKVFKEAMSDDQ